MLNDITKKIEDHGGVLYCTGTLTKYDKPIRFQSKNLFFARIKLQDDNR